MKPPTIFKNIIMYEQVSSTNTIAKESDLENGTVFIAKSQTNGKGRMGRVWESKNGDGIWMSMLLRPNIDPENVFQVSLVSGIAVCEALKEMFEFDFKIKWPNDIVYHGKKVCGILVEMVLKNNRVEKIINGIGINTNANCFPDELKNKATSLFLLTDQKQNNDEITQKVLEKFELYYNLLLDGNVNEIITAFEKLCINKGKEVKIINGGKEITGTATGITEKGELIVEVNGKKLTVNSGEVSIRGIYGCD